MNYFTRVLFRKAIVTGVAAAFTYKLISDEEFRNKAKEKGKEAYENIKNKTKEAIDRTKEYLEKENEEVSDGQIEEIETEEKNEE